MSDSEELASDLHTTTGGKDDLEGDDATVVPSSASAFDVPDLPDGSAGLQPRLDFIFAEVQANLPSIDFEISDVSSDEELSIFSRSVRSPELDKHDDKDNSELSPETWQAALQPSNENLPQGKHKSVPREQRRSSGDATSSNGSVSELQMQDPSILSVGSNIPMSSPIPDFGGNLMPPMWNELISALGIPAPSQSQKNSPDSQLVPKQQQVVEDINRNVTPTGGNRNNSNLLKDPSKEELSLNLENDALSQMVPMEVPTLDVQRIEDIDLDLLIDAFPHPRMGEGRRERRSPVPTSAGEGPSGGSLSLMDKLTQLCIDQSGGNVTKESLVQTPPKQQSRGRGSRIMSSSNGTGGRVTHKTVNIVWQGDEEDDTGSKVTSVRKTDAAVGTDHSLKATQTKKSSPMGVSTSSQSPPVRNMAWMGNSKAQMTRETVYMNLRGFDEKKQEEKPAVSDAVKRILQINSPRGSESSSDSDSDSEDDLQSWIDQRKKARLAAATGVQPDVDHDKPGKMTKLQDQNKPGDHTAERKKRVHSAPTSKQDSRSTGKISTGTSTGVNASSKGNTQTSTPSGSTVAPDDSNISSTRPATAPSAESTEEREKQQKLQAARKLREQREQERASRLQLQDCLAAHRPQTSVSGKLPAAQATDVLFDFEGSYSSAPHTLPPFMSPLQECALLTAHLSASGELSLQHKGSSNRTVDHSGGLSATYPVLLTWLLSLVPRNFDFLVARVDDDWIASKPFIVVGLQQTWQGSDLVLNAAIVPSNMEVLLQQQGSKKGKGRKDLQDCSLFQKHVIQYLSNNTLHSVCSWVQDVFSLAVTSDGQMIKASEQNYRDGILHDGSYIPPLPSISNKPLSTFVTMNRDLKAARKVFDMPPGFYWQTVDSDELMCNQYSSEDYDKPTDVQNTMSLVYSSVYRDPHNMNGVLHRVIQEGLDLSGVRLVYPTEDMSPLPPHVKSQESIILTQEDEMFRDLRRINDVGPTLALGLRGAMARTRWLDAVGPSDPQLARRTDPKSLMALFGGKSREEATIYCPRQPSRVNHEMCIWFGGRVPASGVVDIGISQIQSEHKTRSASPKRKKGKKGSKEQQQTDANGDSFPVDLTSFRHPISTLVATTNSDIFLTVAPIVPPLCVATVLATCESRGFQLSGIRRIRLNHHKTTCLGLTGAEMRAFSPVSCTTPTSPANPQGDQLREELEAGFANATHSPMPALILLLRKENAMHQSASLIETLMVTLSIQGMLSTIADNCPSEVLSSNLCFHVSSYSDTLLTSLGGDFTHVPEGDYGLKSAGAFYSNPELEQIAVVTFSGTEALKSVGPKLGKLLGLFPVTSQNQPPTSIAQGLELLGIKWLPSLTSAQAREITPYEVGDRNWQSSIHSLASNPALVCVIRGINAFHNVTGQLGITTQQNAFTNQVKFNLDVLVAPSAETAFRQATLFFRDPELFADPTMRVNMPFLPPLRNPSLEELSITRFAWADEGSPKSGGKKKAKGRQGKGILVVEESILKSMLTGPRPLSTILVIKPYAVRRHLAKILKRTIQENFTIVAMRLTILTTDQAKALLSKADQQNDFLQAMHIEHMTSGPVLILCLQRENAVKKLLNVLGPTHPQEARKSSQFLWRALYGADPINNALHGSLNYTKAVAEQKLLFPDGVCCLQTPDLKADEITCPAIDSIMGSQQASKRTFSMKTYPIRMDSNESISPVNSNHALPEGSSTPTMQSSGVSTSTVDLLLSQHSALCQINCLVLTPPIQLFSVKGHKQGHVQVIDSLLSHGFEIVGMRMVWFHRQQAQEFISICSKQYPKLANILCHGPSIVIAVQRDNAVSCFESAMGSSYDKDSIMARYGEHILHAKDTKEAASHLEFFFDELAPRSQGQILCDD